MKIIQKNKEFTLGGKGGLGKNREKKKLQWGGASNVKKGGQVAKTNGPAGGGGERGRHSRQQMARG